MGEPADFWALLRRPRRAVESWRYTPATGLPASISIGRLTDDATGTWFVLVYHRTIGSLVCRDEAEARADRHQLAVRVMEACGPGRWAPGED